MEGDQEYSRIPCLTIADDLVLLAESEADMQHLLNIWAEVAHQDSFRYNKGKTEWMAFKSTETVSFHIVNQHLEKLQNTHT